MLNADGQNKIAARLAEKPPAALGDSLTKGKGMAMFFSETMERLQQALLFVVAILLVVWTAPFWQSWGATLALSPGLANMITIFLSIVIEALPFVLIGVFGSAAVEVFVSERQLESWLPRNRWVGPPLAALLGLIFPFCECGLVPLARRLLRKGLRPSLVVPFLLAAPIVNPVTAFSTHYAFYGRPEFPLFRLGSAYLLAVSLGFFLVLLEKRYAHPADLAIDRKQAEGVDGDHPCGCGHGHAHGREEGHGHGCHPHASPVDPKIAGGDGRWGSLLSHASDEFFSTGVYLFLGAALASAAQVWLPRAALEAIGLESHLSILLMMALAFGLSVCSAADAFVGAGFLNTVPSGAVLAFLIYGPMVDIKNTLMMVASFRRSFVIGLIFFVTLFCLLIGSAIDLAAPRLFY
ncbi:permease [Heliobacterium gestii]|uniref:Permease n=1 Tax=Heliomicrobium gestii TaxID=2699 RepID=A0A845L8B9_HELGE|nr:permease [Heliomicrobium gestii]MBM7866343.1 uncharacterized membrane protein YraQ (UPF0718 family) [Heliomicrobium gestii]MZP42872.1 permease [Heliomicrobium gestii]